MALAQTLDVTLVRPVRDGTPATPLAMVWFPHAGGMPHAFRRLAALAVGRIDVLAVRLPCRAGEPRPAAPDLRALAAASAHRVGDSLADRPLVLLGHSMGAALAFETAALLAGDRRLEALVVSAHPASPDPSGPKHWMDDPRLVAELSELGGIPEELDPDLLPTFLATVRYDLEALETHQPPNAVVGCPVLALAASDDRSTTPAAMEPWGSRTRGPFSLVTVPGGHFSLLERPGPAVDAVCAFLTTLAAHGDEGIHAGRNGPP